MLQSEQSDILHNCYPLHILLEFDLGFLRKYSEYIIGLELAIDPPPPSFTKIIKDVDG